VVRREGEEMEMKQDIEEMKEFNESKVGRP
jgi:hypothetical protein